VRRRPARRLDDVRRPQILATAVELVREKGLWSVRIADIARRAGLSPASVVYYFGTKDQLLTDAITAADDAFYGPAVEELATLQRATARMGRLIALSSDTDWLLWMELWVYARHHPATADAQRRFTDRWVGAIEAVVEYGAETGEWSVADPHAVALRLASLTDGLSVHMVLGHPDYTRERYIDMTLVAASLELGCDLGELRDAAAGADL
jgi:AcrR family transcriptional regulator